MSLSIHQVRDDLLRKLGVDDADDATEPQLADVATAICWALQMMHTAGEDFFTRAPINVAFTAGDASKALAGTVQSVLGPVRMPTGEPLRALSSRGELDAYGVLFLGQTSYTVAAGTPQAYWVECLRDTTALGEDMVKMNLHLVPKPSSTMTVVVEGVEECQNVEPADITPPHADAALAVPNQYSESIFLPLARYALTRSNDFSRAELREELEKDFKLALGTLGLKGGFPPEKQADRREVVA